MGPERTRIDIERLPGVVVVRIQGAINEDFDKAPMQGALAELKQPVVVDLNGVPRITSFGVREFIRALTVPGTGSSGPRQVFFVGCRPSLVAQFNSVAQLGASGQIVTLYLPYVCPACSKDFEILTDVRKHGDQLRALQVPEATCPSCNASPADFDDLEASYLSRIAEQPLLVVPGAVDALLDGKAPPTRALRIFKDIAGDVTALWLAGKLDGSPRLKRHAEGLEGDTVVVLAGITSVDEAGVAVFGDIVKADANVYLAKVPLALAQMLAADPARCGKAKILSVHAVVTCDTCRAPREPDLTARIRSGGKVVCPTCGSELAVDALDTVDWEKLASLPFGDAPPAVAAYLATHPGDDGKSSELQNTPTSKLAPETTIGKYQILRRIGMGGMAEVFLGRHVGLEGFEKKVVIKRILPHIAVQPSFVQQFLEEARVAARLAHPHIVQIFDLGREGSSYFIVMELVNGFDFNALIRMAVVLDEQIPIGVAARVGAATCAGLHAAHNYRDEDGVLKPVIHRDVSPHNILVGLDGSVKIADFGVAKAAGSTSKTGAGTLKGKVLYMAPEHVLGHGADHRVDIFAAGLCIYYALVLTHPFARTNEVTSLKAVLEAEIERPRALRPEVPEELDRIVMKALERDPNKRYATAGEMAADLEKFLVSEPNSTFGSVADWMKGVVERHAKLTPRALPMRPEADELAATTITTPDRAIERAQIKTAVNAGAVVPGDDDDL